MQNLLTNLGFYHTGECMCGGTKNLKYKHSEFPELEVRVKPNARKYEIRKYSKTIISGPPDTLELKITEQIAVCEKHKL